MNNMFLSSYDLQSLSVNLRTWRRAENSERGEGNFKRESGKYLEFPAVDWKLVAGKKGGGGRWGIPGGKVGQSFLGRGKRNTPVSST